MLRISISVVGTQTMSWTPFVIDAVAKSTDWGDGAGKMLRQQKKKALDRW